MKIDVFLFTCATPDDPIRWHLLQAVVARWERDLDHINLHVVTEIGEGLNDHLHLLPCIRRDFQSRSLLYADAASQSPIYIFTVDDLMPMQRDFVTRGLNYMYDHPTYTVLGASPFAVVTRQLPPIWPTLDVAATRFVRRGPSTTVGLPHLSDPARWHDRHLDHWLNAAGYSTGRIRDVNFNHLGEGLGVTWPDNFNSNQTQLHNWEAPSRPFTDMYQDMSE